MMRTGFSVMRLISASTASAVPARLFRREDAINMDRANIDTTLNVYTQVLDGSVRDAVQGRPRIRN